MMGETFSVLDIYVFMLGRWTRGFKGDASSTQPARSLAAWPHLGPFMERMRSRPSVQRAALTEGLKDVLI